MYDIVSVYKMIETGKIGKGSGIFFYLMNIVECDQWTIQRNSMKQESYQTII